MTDRGVVKRWGGYSALRIARNLPEGGKLLSVEKDSLWVISHLGGGFKHFLCSTLPGEMIQFDEHIFQTGWNHQPFQMSLLPRSSDARTSSLLPSQRRSSSLPVWTTRPEGPPASGLAARQGHRQHCDCCFHMQVKIWMGTVHSEIANITNRPQPNWMSCSAFLCYAKDVEVIQVWWCVKVGTGTSWLCSSWPLEGGLVQIERNWCRGMVLSLTSLDLSWRSANQPLQGFICLLVLCFCCIML